jgi:hypothetical protein
MSYARKVTVMTTVASFVSLAREMRAASLICKKGTKVSQILPHGRDLGTPFGEGTRHLPKKLLKRVSKRDARCVV